MKFTDVLDALGLLLVIAFAYFIWPPLVLLAAGLSCLLISFLRSRRGR